jgi:hypothetical protein
MSQLNPPDLVTVLISLDPEEALEGVGTLSTRSDAPNMINGEWTRRSR